MLGKRPHQIQRSTSMSQLRAPPGARTRPPASPFAPAKAECASHDNNSPIASMKTAAPHNSQPHTLMEDAAQLLEKKIESPHDINLRSVDERSPTVHAYMEYSQAKDPHLPLKAASSLPLIAKFTRKESFLDACFFCKRPLGHGRDIFMYRGDAAFCTEECRLRQISCDEKCSVSASHSATTDNTAGNPKSTRTTTPTGAF